MQKRQTNRIKQNAKVILIISCVFAVISSVLLIIMLYDLPQTLEYRQKAKDLYENGIEVDAYIKGCYKNYAVDEYGGRYAGHFRIVYEYIDDDNRLYRDEYMDPVSCKTNEDWNEREQYIKQLIADGETIKMLIADNGLCCLSVYKESLIEPKNLIISILIISVSSVVLGLCIFGIVRQSKLLRRFGNNRVNNC